MKLKPGHGILMLFVVVLGWFALDIQSAEEKEAFACPPCGSSCDNTTFHEAGACPVCGMTLVTKSSLTQPAQQSTRPTRQAAEAQQMKVGIFVFEGVQIIDYTGPYEVFGQAGFEVFTVAEKKDAISTAMGMSINPGYTFADHPVADVLVIPGGDVPSHQDKTQVIQWIQENAKKAKVVLSVCNGAFFLARAGLLDGLEATTFASLIDGLKAAAPKTKVVSNQRFVDNGKIVTSAGLSSGIDGSLHVIEKMLGRGYAEIVATGLEYNWDPESKYVRAALADKYIRNTYRFIYPYDREVLSYEGGVDRWSTSWKIKSDQNAASVMNSLSDHLASVEKWKRQTSQDPAQSAWQFSDENGKSWSGIASVKPVPGETGAMTLTLMINRK